MNSSYTLFHDALHAAKKLRILLDNRMCEVAAVIQDHVRLPVVSCDTLFNTPPEIFLALPLPSKNGEEGLGQSSSYFILGRVDVASAASDLSSKCTQCFDENLENKKVSNNLTASCSRYIYTARPSHLQKS